LRGTRLCGPLRVLHDELAKRRSGIRSPFLVTCMTGSFKGRPVLSCTCPTWKKWDFVSSGEDGEAPSQDVLRMLIFENSRIDFRNSACRFPKICVLVSPSREIFRECRVSKVNVQSFKTPHFLCAHSRETFLKRGFLRIKNGHGNVKTWPFLGMNQLSCSK
jgi:hypothetical protein